LQVIKNSCIFNFSEKFDLSFQRQTMPARSQFYMEDYLDIERIIPQKLFGDITIDQLVLFDCFDME
jgi:hypothetical protein